MQSIINETISTANWVRGPKSRNRDLFAVSPSHPTWGGEILIFSHEEFTWQPVNCFKLLQGVEFRTSDDGYPTEALYSTSNTWGASPRLPGLYINRSDAEQGEKIAYYEEIH